MLSLEERIKLLDSDLSQIAPSDLLKELESYYLDEVNNVLSE